MFEVRWMRVADAELMEIWSQATNRNAITAAVDAVDRQLKSDPIDLGESREGAERILFATPLIVRFQVFEEDRRVLVLGVRPLRKRDG